MIAYKTSVLVVGFINLIVFFFPLFGVCAVPLLETCQLATLNPVSLYYDLIIITWLLLFVFVR
jgi:hypothetical protein